MVTLSIAMTEWDKEGKDVVYAFQLHFNPKMLVE